MAGTSSKVTPLTSHLVSALLATCNFLHAAYTAHAHGFIADPPARQLCNGKETQYSVTVSGGNGGRGKKPVQLGGMPGICGDPFQSNEKYPYSKLNSMPCEPQAVYKQGQNIRLKIALVANHGGFFEFRICDKKDADLDCFKKDKHLLMTVDHPDHGDWHLMGASKNNPTQSDPEYHYVDLKLPDDVSCSHCVIMWTWWTAHHCVYPCDKEVCGFYADRVVPFIRKNTNWAMDYCKSKNPEPGDKPQVFRNCVDVAVTPDGSAPVRTDDDDDDKGKKPKSQFVEEEDSDEVSLKVEKSRKAVSKSKITEEDDEGGSKIVERSSIEQERSLISFKSKKTEKKGGGDSKTYLTKYKNLSSQKKQSQTTVSSSGKSKKNRSRQPENRERKSKGRSKDRSRAKKNRSRKPKKRRSLLEEGEEEGEEGEKLLEVDLPNPDSMSSAGMMIDCHDDEVKKAFKSLNKFRKDNNIDAPLKCSNRATGVAENFGDVMCQQGRVMDDDPMDLFDNCELSDFQFSGNCEQVVGKLHPSNLTDAKEKSVENVSKFLNSIHMEAGIGYHKCGDSKIWTYLFL